MRNRAREIITAGVNKAIAAGGVVIEEKPTLACMKERAERLRQEHESLVARKFPGRDHYDWSRAVDNAGPNPIARQNDDTSDDAAMVADSEIKESWDSYIKALHAFYLARDGAGGVLGSRGL
jgi:hypothetical protein